MDRARNWLDRLICWVKQKVIPWAESNPGKAAGVAAVASCGCLLWIGGSVIVNGLIAGTLVSTAVGILVWKTKKVVPWAYDTMVQYPLVSDVAISVLAFTVSPAGITGWIAASVAALLASTWLLSAKESTGAEIVAEATVLSVK